MKVIFAASIAVLAFSASALAQDANAVTTPQEFVDMAAVSNMFEITSSKVALEKASEQPTKDFAQHMIADHSKAGEELKAAADAEGVKVPTALDAKHQADLDNLAGSTGGAFDQSYLAEQYAAHEEAVTLFTTYSTNGAPGALKEFATKTLPTLQSHLKHVQQLATAK
jgi:putative membrane protein